MVRPKKRLGQHFLKDKNIARKIVEALQLPEEGISAVLEIGAGTGVLTRFLLEKKNINLRLVEIDSEAAGFLRKEFPGLDDRLIETDFLDLDLGRVFDVPFHVIGNFPYNISSQIFFKLLEHRDQVKEVVCMLQKEVADRIASKHGSKVYGILSVLLQAYYDVDNVLKVSPGVFVPPPKVMSSVIRLKRNKRVKLECDEALFHQVVRQSFQKRRKTLRNALKHLNLPRSVEESGLMDKRPEQLSVEDFISLVRRIGQSGELHRI